MGSGVSQTARTEQLELLPAQLHPAQLRCLVGVCFDAGAYPESAATPGDGAGSDGHVHHVPALIPRARVVETLRANGVDVHGSDVFWANLRHVSRVRRGLDAACAALPRHHELKHGVASFDRTKTAPRKDGGGAGMVPLPFDGAFRQQAGPVGRRPGAPVRDLGELYAAAEAARPAFEALLARCAAGAGIADARVKAIALEGRGRAGEKAHAKFGRRDPGPAVAWLFDVVRGKIVCATGGEILGLYEQLARQRFRGALFTHWGSEWGTDLPRTLSSSDQVSAPL